MLLHSVIFNFNVADSFLLVPILILDYRFGSAQELRIAD